MSGTWETNLVDCEMDTAEIRKAKLELAIILS